MLFYMEIIEAVVRRYSVKKVYLEISQNSQESTYRIGSSLSDKKFFMILGDSIAEVTINRELKDRGRPMRGGYRCREIF